VAVPRLRLFTGRSPFGGFFARRSLRRIWPVPGLGRASRYSMAQGYFVDRHLFAGPGHQLFFGNFSNVMFLPYSLIGLNLMLQTLLSIDTALKSNNLYT
jgi:hypothetical protein